MKKVFKIIILFAILFILSMFVFYKKEVILFTPNAQIKIEAPISEEKNLTIRYNETDLPAQINNNESESYTFKAQEKGIIFSIYSKKGTLITLNLYNPHKEHTLQYNSLVINGQNAFKIPQKMEPGMSYDYTFITKKEKDYTVELQWDLVQ